MKTASEYLEKALSFQRMADKETDMRLRAKLTEQAKAYLRLAAESELRQNVSKHAVRTIVTRARYK